MPTERVLGDNAGVAGLIRCIYDAALDARRSSDFLARFCVTFSSDAALIFGQDFSSQTVEVTGGPTQLAAHHGFSDSAIRDFGAHYCHGNVWTSDERLHREGCVVVGAQLYPEKYLLRTEWGDWMHSQDLFHTFAAVVEKREQRSFNLSGLRSQRGGPYSDAEQARLYGLMPHLQTAFALHRRLHRTEALAQASLAVLDGLPIGVVLLGEQARVLHANARAQHMLQRSGLLRLGADEYLHAAAANDELRLQRAMRWSVATGQGQPISAGTAMRLSGLDGGQLQLLVTPLPQWSQPFGQYAAAAVFISDPAAKLQSMEQALQGWYCMTPAEARLTQALVHGLSLQEYAAQAELSFHTVRSQLKAVVGKVGVGRQADLVRVVLTGPAIMRWQTATVPD